MAKRNLGFQGRTIVRLVASLALASGLLAPRAALAQQGDEWEITFAPLYFWAMELNGELTVGNRTAPLFLDFADAADNLGGAFSFHVEARKGRWGVLSDLNFVRLSSDAEFTLPNRVIEADFDLDNIMFEAGGSYLLSERARFAVIGGLRTYTLSPKIEFRGPLADVTPVDRSRTSANVFGGFTYRPQLSDKWHFVSRADLGAGQAEFTWSGMLGFEYRFRQWGGFVFGYKALGLDTGDADDPDELTEYDITHYGPIFGLTMHWGGR